ncbi:hypothetical protein [Streptomyces sp. URMC 123]|uniref:hypothetical protein n=1 Tax=Streptomyces sp. URMC 123 TaxID=3423403 RepID=UPI003F1BE55A
MDLAGAAAVLALLSIPASVLIARWQMRTTLAQSEATYRAALEVAEVNHRAALEVLDANHQKALETAEANHQRALELAAASHRGALDVARKQAEAEHLRWITEARTAEYRLFEASLAQFRRVFLADEVVKNELIDAHHEMHRSRYAIRQLGPGEVYDVVERIDLQCGLILVRFAKRTSQIPIERAEWWQRAIAPLRLELGEAVKGMLDRHIASI